MVNKLPKQAPVALFVTCLVDVYRPEVGEATVALLERLGVPVEFPPEQTCCGASVYHDGWQDEATTAARRWIEIFEPFVAVVAPSAACVAMVRQEYPRLLAGDPRWQRRAEALAARTYTLSEFLVDVLGVSDPGASFEGKLAYQPACQLLHGLGVDAQPRALLAAVEGAELVPLPEAEACCGFGGPFSINNPILSSVLAERKARSVVASGADVVVTCETGCLLQIESALSRQESPCRAVHLAELLAGNLT